VPDSSSRGTSAGESQQEQRDAVEDALLWDYRFRASPMLKGNLLFTPSIVLLFMNWIGIMLAYMVGELVQCHVLH
jgi:hypothetical protein